MQTSQKILFYLFILIDFSLIWIYQTVAIGDQGHRMGFHTIFQVCLSISTKSAVSTLFWEQKIISKLAQWLLNYPMALELVTWSGSCENISIPFLPAYFRIYSINLCHCLHYVYLTKFCISWVLETLISVPEFSIDVQFTNRKTDVYFIHSLLNFQGNFWPLKRNYSAVSGWFLHILKSSNFSVVKNPVWIPGPLLVLTVSMSNSYSFLHFYYLHKSSQEISKQQICHLLIEMYHMFFCEVLKGRRGTVEEELKDFSPWDGMLK